MKDSVEISPYAYKETLLFSKFQETMKITVRSANWCKEVSRDLQKWTVKALKNSEEIPWPPTAL